MSEKKGKISSFFSKLANTSIADVASTVKGAAVTTGSYIAHSSPASVTHDIKKVFHDAELRAEQAKLNIQNQAVNAKLSAGLFLISNAVQEMGLKPEDLAHLLGGQAAANADKQ